MNIQPFQKLFVLLYFIAFAIKCQQKDAKLMKSFGILTVITRIGSFLLLLHDLTQLYGAD